MVDQTKEETVNDAHLPVTASENSEGAYLWIIEAQFDFLDRFCLEAGLGRDSAVPLVFTLPPDRFAPARLTYPSAHCPRPEPWLKVLGLLHLRRIAFTLYQATGRHGALTSLTQLRPAIDGELNALLGFAAQGRIGQLQVYSQMLERMFAKLESASAGV